jgi:predicted transposase/invertase (TIGR01784 family)
MKRLLTPKLDLVFKLLFTKAPELLLNLVNAVLEYPHHVHIQEIHVTNPIILPEELTEKLIILDLQAIDERGHYYDIEMQVRKYASYPERTLYYLSRLYAGQLESGEQYEQLRPVIGVHFVDYTQFPNYPPWHFCFELCDVRYPELCLTQDLSLHVFELPKLAQQVQAERWGNPMFEWLHFFNHAHEEGEKTMQTQYKNPVIHKAFQVLETLSADEETRLRAEIREKALKNARSELWAARAEGRAEGIIEGFVQGIAVSLEIKFGEAGIALQETLKKMTDVEKLREISEVIKHAQDLKEIKQLLNIQE